MSNVWHDAKTDPPKKDGRYNVTLEGKEDVYAKDYRKLIVGEGWDTDCKVLLWTEIPPLPDPELEEFDKWWNGEFPKWWTEEKAKKLITNYDVAEIAWRAGRAKLREGK